MTFHLVVFLQNVYHTRAARPVGYWLQLVQVIVWAEEQIGGGDLIPASYI